MDETYSPFQDITTEELQALERLFHRREFELYVEVMGRFRDVAFERIRNGLMTNSAPVDQREIDKQRGKWDGVDLFGRRFPQSVHRELEKRLQSEDEAEGG